VVLASQAIRAVAMGVVVTALVQSSVAGLGLLIAGIPYVMILVVLMFLLIVAQIGPFPVLLASVGYLYWSGDTTWGTFLLVWSLLAGTMDNFLRPFLIKRGADLPLILILVGVIGACWRWGSSVSSSAPWCWRWATPCWMPGSRKMTNRRALWWNRPRRRDDSFIPDAKSRPRAALLFVAMAANRTFLPVGRVTDHPHRPRQHKPY
jgi:hypothetical protein